MCRSFRSLDRRAWAPAHGDAGLGRQLAGEDLSGRPCPRDPAMLASVVNQVPHCGFPVASLVGFIGTCGLFVAGFPCRATGLRGRTRSEEHTSELQSLMRTSSAVFCLKKKNK